MKALSHLVPVVREQGRFRLSKEACLALAKLVLGIAVMSGALTPEQADDATTGAVAELLQHALGTYMVLRGLSDNYQRHREAEEQVEAQPEEQE